MTARSIAQQRLYQQQIEHPRLDDPVAVAAWFGAIQAQDYAGAKWSLGLRVPGSTDAQIEKLIAGHALIRTWAMRGTLHLLAAADLRWLIDLIGPRIINKNQRRYRQLELDEATLERSNSAIIAALADGKQLDRAALLTALEDQGIFTQGQRGYYMLNHASISGLIVQGVEARYNQAMFMRVDEALPASQKLSHEAALAELARRYFVSRGPATLQDFITWSGLLVADAKAGLASVKNQLVADTFDNDEYWFTPDPIPAPALSPTAYTLPGFDEYILGYKNRDAVLDPEHAQKICPGKNGVFYPTIVLDGQVVGTWKRSFKQGSIIIELAPFAPLSTGALAAITQAVRRFGDYHQLPVVLE